MPNYLRNWQPGATYFFTVNLLERGGNDLLIRQVDALRDAVRTTHAERPFDIVAWVVLPDHMHAIWTLPEGDADYATRWGAIKARFSRAIPRDEFRNESRQSRNERGIWQRRRTLTTEGTHYPRCTRSREPHRLHPQQPGEAWLCGTGKPA